MKTVLERTFCHSGRCLISTGRPSTSEISWLRTGEDAWAHADAWRRNSKNRKREDLSANRFILHAPQSREYRVPAARIHMISPKNRLRQRTVSIHTIWYRPKRLRYTLWE